jgi:G3E family GTPase
VLTRDDDVSSFVFRDTRPFELGKLETFLGLLIQTYSRDMLRYKGVLHVHDNPRRVLFQGVHMIMGADEGKPWGLDEHRESKMVFIGRKLPRDLFEKGLALCVHGAAESPPTG